MKKICTLISFSLLFHFFSKAEKRKILFLGNSYTYVNDLPNTLKQLALSFGDSIDVDSYCPGGSTLNSLYNDANTLAKIQIPGWDYVVVQAQSQEPSFSPVQVASDTYPYAKKLDSLIHISNPCAETIFYMTWGRKNGDAGNCAAYPPVCTYEGMQQRLRESYLEMANDNQASCSPVGVAWRTYRNLFPNVELYNPDESHPSANGTYLAACVFYSTLYQKSANGASYVLNGVAIADVAGLQNTGSTTVLDSIENWQQHGHLPNADFTFSVAQNVVTFTNTSLRASTYEWDFGDGSPTVVLQSPTHTYAATGNFTVTLKSVSSCNRYSVESKVISINSIPNSILENSITPTPSIRYTTGNIIITGTLNAITVYDINGKKMLETIEQLRDTQIDCSRLPAGLYFYKAENEEKNNLSGSFLIH